MRVLVLNPGSSTLKASVIAPGADASATVTVDWPAGELDAGVALGHAIEDVDAHGVSAVGYRVVHGGADHVAPERVSEALIAAVETLDRLAPLHNRRAAAVMRDGLARFPRTVHVACFDTAFHAGLPDAARSYALPPDWVAALGIRRFGFHGLSVAWSVRRAAELLDRPIESLALVVAHLGSGCSVTAVLGGRSLATSMGMTPLEGLVMGTRPGSIDPGILVELLRHGIGVDELASGLSERSGLLALTGGEARVEVLERLARGGDAQARRALEIFARSAAAGIAAAATALPRLDALVFTGGIGEHSSGVRGEIVARLGSLAVPSTLEAGTPDTVLAGGPPAVIAIGAREDRVIADAVAEHVAAGDG